MKNLLLKVWFAKQILKYSNAATFWDKKWALTTNNLTTTFISHYETTWRSPPERSQLVRWNPDKQCTNGLTGSEKGSSRRTIPPGEMNVFITSTRPTMSQPKKDCKSRLQWSVEPLLSDTSNQGTPPFTGHKILSRKDAHIIYASNASIEGTPLFTGKGPFFWVLF